MRKHDQKEQSEKGYHFPYAVQLLLEKEVKLEQGNLIEHSLQSQFIISEPESIENPLEVFLPSLIQTWDWPDAKLQFQKRKRSLKLRIVLLKP